ncbi:MAG: hypothetical protein V3W19_02530, partial [Desulfatiglandales bacterium]
MRGWVALALIILAIGPAHALEVMDGLSTSSVGTSPTWNPDGKRIAYQGSDYNIWVMLSDGSSKERLTDDIFRDEQPEFSPSGELIAFVSERGGRQEIWLMDSNGKEKRQITTEFGWKHSP